MNKEELKKNLRYLINKYIVNQSTKDDLLLHIDTKDQIGVKGILNQINIQENVPFEVIDADLIKDIVFYYV
jgi:hypothetical protein